MVVHIANQDNITVKEVNQQNALCVDCIED